MTCPRCGTVFCDDADYPPGAAPTRKRYCSKTCKRKDGASYRKNKRLREIKPRRVTWPDGCTRPGKERFYTPLDARARAREIRDRAGLCLTPYLCPCGLWHLKSGAPLSALERLAAFGSCP